MKRLAIAVATALAVATPAVMAQDYWYPERTYSETRDSRYTARDERINERGFARVIESRPIYAASARQECWNPRAGTYEMVREENRTRIGKGAAIGALAGGVLGHQVDQGGGTAAGALLGGLLGHQIERRRDRSGGQDDLDYGNCRAVGASAADIERYEVRYVYDGREYVTHLSHDPGARLRLGEDVRRDGTPYG